MGIVELLVDSVGLFAALRGSVGGLEDFPKHIHSVMLNYSLACFVVNEGTGSF